jgi:hypothetical protein
MFKDMFMGGIVSVRSGRAQEANTATKKGDPEAALSIGLEALGQRNLEVAARL